MTKIEQENKASSEQRKKDCGFLVCLKKNGKSGIALEVENEHGNEKASDRDASIGLNLKYVFQI